MVRTIRPVIVIETIEGRRSDRRPVLPQEKYLEQVELLHSRGCHPPLETHCPYDVRSFA